MLKLRGKYILFYFIEKSTHKFTILIQFINNQIRCFYYAFKNERVNNTWCIRGENNVDYVHTCFIRKFIFLISALH